MSEAIEDGCVKGSIMSVVGLQVESWWSIGDRFGVEVRTLRSRFETHARNNPPSYYVAKTHAVECAEPVPPGTPSGAPA